MHFSNLLGTHKMIANVDALDLLDMVLSKECSLEILNLLLRFIFLLKL